MYRESDVGGVVNEGSVGMRLMVDNDASWCR